MYEEIFKLIEKGELDKAQEMIDKTPENDPKRYNISGLIYYQKKELEKAKEEFEKGLKIDAVDSDLLFNYGYLLKEMNQEKEAWRYLMRIHKKDWATYYMLGDIEFKTRSKLSALRFYKKAAELTDSPNEMKKKFLDMRNNIKQDTKIAFLCLPGLDNFLKDIVETFSLGYDVKLVVTTDGNQIAEAIKWADIVWLEWANDLAIFATNNVPEIQNKKVVCRLHGYEAFTQFPEKINWANIDKLIFVGDHIKRILHELHPNLNIDPTKEVAVPNGVDLDRFKFSLHKPGYNLAILARINYRKNPEFWIQIINKLKEVDNRYKLHVGGDFQDPRYFVYFNYIKKEMKIEDNFILHGWIDNVEEFLEDKDYILSTSIHEGHPYNILESMARGIKPIIHNYSGLKEQWPNELIYNTIDEAVEKITEQTYDSEGYRRFIEDNYPLEKQIDNTYCLLTNNSNFKEKSFLDKNKINNEYYEILKKSVHILSKPHYFSGIDDFTIVIPHYNRADILISDLENGYKFGNQRKIIIDGCSNGENIEKIKQLEKRKEEFGIEMIYYNEKNEGLAINRRKGAELVKTDYLMILDDDDIVVCLDEKKFQEDFRKYTNFKDKYYSMMARYVVGFEEGTKLWVQYDRNNFASMSPEETLVFLLNGEIKQGFATQIISTYFMRKHSAEGIFYSTEDYVSWCRLLAKSPKKSKMLVSKNYLEIRRISDSSVSRTINKEKLSLHFLSLLICGYYCLEKNLVSKEEFFTYLNNRISLINSIYGFGVEYGELLNNYLNKIISLEEFININNNHYIKSLTMENVPYEVKNILNFM